MTFSYLVTECVRSLRRRLYDLAHPYRPELNYMRGPGPKWFEKHGHSMQLSPTAAGPKVRSVAR
jgi:hypothetical protein